MSEPVLTPEDVTDLRIAWCEGRGNVRVTAERIVARHRVVAAEAARAELVASITALADEWDEWADVAQMESSDVAEAFADVASDLRALVVPDHAGPTGDPAHP